MAKIITDEDVRALLKSPYITEYMVLRDKLQQIELMKDQIENLQTVYEMYSRGYFKYKNILSEIKEIVCGNYEIIDSYGRKEIIKLLNKAEV